MRLRSVSAMLFVIAGFALVIFETSVYGVKPLDAEAVSPVAATGRGARSERHFGTPKTIPANFYAMER